MCGITGYINIKNHKHLSNQSLNKIIHRGLDNTSTYSLENSTFSHCLHSVVGNQPQPIVQEDFIFGANCEIYNWKELAKKYKLKANNDADLLLQFLIFNLKNKRPNEKILNKIS